MDIGVTLRNMGPQSTPDIMQAGTLRAEELGFESIWITDHIAIPPDDSEGSGGRYTDPLTTLAWMAGFTSNIKLGVGVLIIPYRPALPTVKQIATVQEFSNQRLLLGAAVGWMDPEFTALGINRHQRGKITDATLEFLQDYFTNEVVTLNGQPFIAKPRPAPPALYIGGSAPHALKRAIRFDCGWLPMARTPDKLAVDLATYTRLAQEAGKVPGPVTAMTGLPVDDIAASVDLLQAYEALNVERLVCALRYDTAEEYGDRLDALNNIRSAFQQA